MIEILHSTTISLFDLIIGLGGFIIFYCIYYKIKDLNSELVFLVSKMMVEDIQASKNANKIDEIDDEMVYVQSCPMCGEDRAEMSTTELADGSIWYFITCSANNGGCGLSTAAYATPDEAINAWNQRKYKDE